MNSCVRDFFSEVSDKDVIHDVLAGESFKAPVGMSLTIEPQFPILYTAPCLVSCDFNPDLIGFCVTGEISGERVRERVSREYRDLLLEDLRLGTFDARLSDLRRRKGIKLETF